MDNFEAINMYRCKWCNKIFHTTTHKCKFNPNNHNCLSCKHCKGFDKYDGQYDEVGRCEVEPYSSFICEIEDNESEENSDLNKLYLNKWKSSCKNYKEIDGYKGKDSYLNNIN